MAGNPVWSWWLKPKQKFSGIKQLFFHVEPARAVNEKCFFSVLVLVSCKHEVALGVRKNQEQRVATMQVRQQPYATGAQAHRTREAEPGGESNSSHLKLIQETQTLCQEQS